MENEPWEVPGRSGSGEMQSKPRGLSLHTLRDGQSKTRLCGGGGAGPSSIATGNGSRNGLENI